MSAHLSRERLNDLVDGLLEGPVLESTLSHLDSCSACGALLRDLDHLVDDLHALPGEAQPTRDLWPGIRARLADSGNDVAADIESSVNVIAFPEGARARSLGHVRRRLSFTLPQLAAAAILIALLSAGGAWWALPRALSPASGEGGPSAAAPLGVLPAALPLDGAVADLETTLKEGQELLDPETVRVIEESLAAIDQAIAEARQALAEDPGSDLLNRLLISHQMAKLRLLQKATAGLIRA